MEKVEKTEVAQLDFINKSSAGRDNGWTLSASGSRSPRRALLTIWSSSKNRGGRNWWSEILQFCMHGVGGFK